MPLSRARAVAKKTRVALLQRRVPRQAASALARKDARVDALQVAGADRAAGAYNDAARQWCAVGPVPTSRNFKSKARPTPTVVGQPRPAREMLPKERNQLHVCRSTQAIGTHPPPGPVRSTDSQSRRPNMSHATYTVA